MSLNYSRLWICHNTQAIISEVYKQCEENEDTEKLKCYLTASSSFTISNLGLYVKSTTWSHNSGIDPLTYKRKTNKVCKTMWYLKKRQYKRVHAMKQTSISCQQECKYTFKIEIFPTSHFTKSQKLLVFFFVDDKV